MDKLDIKVIEDKDMTVYLKDGRLDIRNNDDYISCNDYRIEFKDGNNLVMYIEGFFFNVNYMRDNGVSVFECFDSVNQDVYELYEVVFDKEDYREEFEVFNENLFYVDKIYVEEKYRNKGYASMVINEIDDIVKYVLRLDVGVIATLIYSEDNNEELKGKLRDLLIDNYFNETSKDRDYLVKMIY